MLIRIIFIVIGVIFIIYGVIYSLVQHNTSVNYKSTFNSILVCCMGILLIVMGNWFISDIFEAALEKRKLAELREQYTYIYDGNTIVYEGFNKLKYNSLEYDLDYDDTNKTVTLTKAQTIEQSTIILCCSCILLVTSLGISIKNSSS